MKPLLTLSRLKVGYAGKPILEGFTHEIFPKNFLSIVGSNGSGKTTLIKTILGLLPPVSGHIKGSEDLRFGYVPQKSGVNSSFPLTVEQIVMLGRVKKMGLFSKPKANDYHVVLQCLKEVSLEDLAQNYLHTLSGGQYQRMMIARALASEPTVLVLDEPTTGMDIVAEHDFLNLIAKVRTHHNLTVIMVTHDLSTAAECSDSLVVINSSDKSVTVGPPLEVLTNKRLSNLFHRPLQVLKTEAGVTFAVGDENDSNT